MAKDTSKDTTPKEQFHFSGSGEWMPMTVLASDRDEATKYWEKHRTPNSNPHIEKLKGGDDVK